MAHQGWLRCAQGGVAALLLLNGCAQRPERTALQEGERLLRGGHYSQSILLFNKAVRDGDRREDRALACNGMGIAFARLHQKENAARMFENAIRMDPGRVEPVYNLGALQCQNGQEAEAVLCFQKAAALDAGETRPLEFLAAIYGGRRQWPEARRALAEAQARAPRSPRVLTALAALELQTNNAAAALAFLQQALEHDARYAPALFNLAAIHQRRDSLPDQARDYFKEFLAFVPEGPHADRARRALQGMAAAPPAAGAVPEASASGPANEGGPPKTAPPAANDWMETAGRLERAGRREAAVNSCLMASREAERQGDGPLRQKALERAAGLAAADARASCALGRYYGERKQYDQAAAWLKKAVGMSTNWFEAHLALAGAALETEEYDTARLSVKQAEKCRPEQADALWALAELCDRNASLRDLAAPFYSSFVQRHPDDGRAGVARERVAALTAGAERPAEESRPGAETNSSWWGWLTR